MKQIKKVMVFGVLCFCTALIGCQNKTNAFTSSVLIRNKTSFKPIDEAIDSKEEYIYEYLGLKFKLSQNIKTAMNQKSLVMLDAQNALNQDLRYAFFSFNTVSKTQKNIVVEDTKDYIKWENSLKREGTIGMYLKGMSQEELTDLTKCKYHKKIGTSDDKQYEYYISYQTEDFLKELMKSNIEIIDRLKETENGFVLKEKKDLDNTEVFDE